MKSLSDIQFVPTSDQNVDMLDRLCETRNEFNNVLAAVTFIDCVDQENELALLCKYLQRVLQHRQAWPSSLAGHVAATIVGKLQLLWIPADLGTELGYQGAYHVNWLL